VSILYKNTDFILSLDVEERARDVAAKYSAFLDCLCAGPYAFQREAIAQAIRFFVSDNYKDTEALARRNYGHNGKLQMRFQHMSDYLERFPLRAKKAVSLELATGTGKSWVLYGIAQIMLAEGLVDKVLVLCPSLTIEEGLKDKFNRFSGDAALQHILRELGSAYPTPAIKNANEPIQPGDICVENIHAVYERTGSSIVDSFKGKGSRTLVLNDEAHHIFSAVDAATKKWMDFLLNEEFGFRYVTNVTGTPYIGDDYFLDIVYRYGLKQAIEDGVVKTVDYKIEEETQRDKSYAETWENHRLNQEKYAGKLKPLTIIVTEKVASCVKVWSELVAFIAGKEHVSFDEAAKKVIWVVSGIPSGNDGAIVKSLVDKPEKTRKENLQRLKTVDDANNPVEWIASVAMLTEGWDVKNVFQIVPHENKAFNSKLLIAQVLGRGLRIPAGVEPPVLVKVNNHEKWTGEIENLYRDILEIENVLSWGHTPAQDAYTFPLYNLRYESVQQTVETKRKRAMEPETVGFAPQSREWTETSRYSHSGPVTTLIENRRIMSIPNAVRQMKIFLKEKDEAIARQWTSRTVQAFLEKNLKRCGCDASFISLENLAKAQQAFGPMLRQVEEANPRMMLQAQDLVEIDMKDVVRQHFTESVLKDTGYLFFSEASLAVFSGEERAVLKQFLDDRANYQVVKEQRERYGGSEEEIRFLKTNLLPVPETDFKTPWDIHFVTFGPEKKFSQSLFDYANLFDAIVKAPDRGFYSFPYSYKPSRTGRSHVKQENFNPDFFLKLAGLNEVLVVEIKQDGDDTTKNRAKNRDGNRHFDELNVRLETAEIEWRYRFYFLSPEDYPEFFDAVRKQGHVGWRSRLMLALEA